MSDYRIDPVGLERLERKIGEIKDCGKSLRDALATIRSVEIDLIVIADSLHTEIEHIMRKAEAE